MFAFRPVACAVLVASICGIGIATVDSCASGGEVSPIVVVALLFSLAAALGALAKRGRLVCTITAWIWLPLAHLLKHMSGLPDTIHPNSYRSIFYLAVFSLVVALVGMVLGAALMGNFRYDGRRRG